MVETVSPLHAAFLVLTTSWNTKTSGLFKNLKATYWHVSVAVYVLLIMFVRGCQMRR